MTNYFQNMSTKCSNFTSSRFINRLDDKLLKYKFKLIFSRGPQIIPDFQKFVYSYILVIFNHKTP